MILVIDNYDSFTWTLVHYLREIGAEVRVERNDAIGADDAIASGAEAILISPGPGTPAEAGISIDLVAACAATRLPLLGVCLGHQAIGQHFGGEVVRSPVLMHGKTSAIAQDGTGVFAELPTPFAATRYHSLVVAAEAMPDCLLVNATASDGTVQGFRHHTLPIHGVQFHPESIASEHGHALLRNFVELAARVAPLDPAAEMLPDRLMAEADAEQRPPCRRAGRDQIERDAGLVGRARPGRDQDRLRSARQRLGRAQRVVALHPDFGADLAQIMDQVPGEAVIIVDDEDHRRRARPTAPPGRAAPASPARSPRGCARCRGWPRPRGRTGRHIRRRGCG